MGQQVSVRPPVGQVMVTARDVYTSELVPNQRSQNVTLQVGLKPPDRTSKRPTEPSDRICFVQLSSCGTTAGDGLLIGTSNIDFDRGAAIFTDISVTLATHPDAGCTHFQFRAEAPGAWAALSRQFEVLPAAPAQLQVKPLQPASKSFRWFVPSVTRDLLSFGWPVRRLPVLAQQASRCRFRLAAAARQTAGRIRQPRDYGRDYGRQPAPPHTRRCAACPHTAWAGELDDPENRPEYDLSIA